MIWSFTLHLRDVPRLSTLQIEALYEAGCEDGSPSSGEGASEIAFDRESPTLQEAIRSAISNVRSVGLDIDRVEIESADIQERELAQWQTA